jgi:epoxyqueuosine reductase
LRREKGGNFLKISKQEITEKAHELGFGDIGFTTAEPFEIQKGILQERFEAYEWAVNMGLDLMTGTDPRQILPQARSIIVLMEVYFHQAFPKSLEAHFGRCYLDDDRISKERLARRVKAFRSFLTEKGIESKLPFYLPHRIAAARAGLGTFGKNCLLYSNKVAGRSSWVLPIPLVVDREFGPDEPTLELGCPEWCRNVCLTACPTGALRGSRHIDPRKCISFLTYYGPGPTPLELREPMGLWVYGCDRCQNVCPRNAPWLAKELPPNPIAAAMVEDFKLTSLLHMDVPYFNSRIWPRMFYMPEKDLWRWKMNVARAMGNTLDDQYIPELIRAFSESGDERVRAMIAWALGRIGGAQSQRFLEKVLPGQEGLIKDEVQAALGMKSH